MVEHADTRHLLQSTLKETKLSLAFASNMMGITGVPGMWDLFFSTSPFSGREFSHSGGKVKLVDSWRKIKIYLDFSLCSSLPHLGENLQTKSALVKLADMENCSCGTF